MTDERSSAESCDLKPCPFCGGEPNISKRMDEDLFTHNIVEWTGVLCTECGISFEWPPAVEPGAVAQWNTRIPTDAQSTREWIAKRCPFCGSPKGQYAASTDALSAAFICKGCGINDETRGSGVEMIDNLSPEALANWQDEGNCNAGRPQCSADSPNVDVLIQRLRAANAGGLREQAYQSLCGDAADALSLLTAVPQQVKVRSYYDCAECRDGQWECTCRGPSLSRPQCGGK